jgi:hypothetical protein
MLCAFKKICRCASRSARKEKERRAHPSSRKVNQSLYAPDHPKKMVEMNPLPKKEIPKKGKHAIGWIVRSIQIKRTFAN